VRERRVAVKLLCGNYWHAAVVGTEDYESDIQEMSESKYQDVR